MAILTHIDIKLGRCSGRRRRRRRCRRRRVDATITFVIAPSHNTDVV